MNNEIECRGSYLVLLILSKQVDSHQASKTYLVINILLKKLLLPIICSTCSYYIYYFRIVLFLPPQLEGSTNKQFIFDDFKLNNKYVHTQVFSFLPLIQLSCFLLWLQICFSC